MITINLNSDSVDLDEDETVEAALNDDTYTDFLVGYGSNNEDAIEDLKDKVEKRIVALQKIEWNKISIE